VNQTIRRKTNKDPIAGKDSKSENANKGSVFVTFWGTRGTLPCPGVSSLRYGGNTSCVEVTVRDPIHSSQFSIILDAGSGLARYGDFALQRGEREFHIFLSHMHYDHIIGLTRFAPLFRSDCKVRFYATPKGNKGLKESFRDFFSLPFFPIEFSMLPSLRELKFIEIEDHIQIDSLVIHTQELHHPQGASAFRVQYKPKNQSLIYVTDHEHGTEIDERLIQFCQDGSLLLYDSTYSEISYPNHIGWGHSTAYQGAKLAALARCKAYGLFHHDCFATDDQLENILLPEAKREHPFSFLCSENLTISMDQLMESEFPKALSPQFPPSPMSVYGGQTGPLSKKSS
jgi:phosphoribosyl 1,2-cyclic phosphodiesterase